MSLKAVVGLCLVLIALETVLGAPHSAKNEKDLKKSFVEFLQQDKEISALLKEANLGPQALSRVARQVEEEFASNEAGEEPKKDGFFDRAAKFVMEVLQRFLKWINTED